MDNKDRFCPMNPNTNKIPAAFPAWVAWLAFSIGLTGAVFVRLILVAKAYWPDMIRPFWYIAILGNMIFFLFRAFITYRRKGLIARLNLLEKLQNKNSLCPQDYMALRYLITSLYTSKEMWNYAVIFILSILAIVWDLVFGS
ncbi:hypothetical protein [Dissulfurimicrobium hydrothermale]|uniref:hypothetical protein n=1 Tax=Dissulfurimicrobium hydrothermale TaxID=1750598 RepID=UPI001EDC6920|nr:hypothetical protein [Dissulfurimicrobium hydrothermale]UKL13730.1 hypothetical protein LGS26_00125 [Dissulfurimicrobium hydrothermale]